MMGHGCGKSWCDGESPTFIGTAGQHKWDEACLLFASILMDLYFELGSISGTVQSDLLELGLHLRLQVHICVDCEVSPYVVVNF